MNIAVLIKLHLNNLFFNDFIEQRPTRLSYRKKSISHHHKLLLNTCVKFEIEMELAERT